MEICHSPQQAGLVWNAVDTDLSQLKFAIVSNTGLFLGGQPTKKNFTAETNPACCSELNSSSSLRIFSEFWELGIVVFNLGQFLLGFGERMLMK